MAKQTKQRNAEQLEALFRERFPRPSDPAPPRDPRDLQDRRGFFIEPTECLTCGCCEAEAPQNFGTLGSQIDIETGETHDYPSSYVKKQPQTPEELTATIKAAAYCMVDCIYYSGDDPEVFRQWSKHWDDQDANWARHQAQKAKTEDDPNAS